MTNTETSLQTLVSNLQSKIHAHKETIKVNIEQINRLQEGVSIAKSTEDCLIGRNNDLKSVIDGLEIKIIDANKKVRELEDRVDFRDNVIERLEGKCERFTLVNQTLRRTIMAIVNEIKEEV